MTDETTPDREDAEPQPKPTGRWVSKFLIAVTSLIIAFLVLGHVFVSEIDDLFGMGLDVVNFVTWMAAGPLILLWTGWVLVLSRWRWAHRVVVAGILVGLPLTLLSVFRPVGGGDVGIMRWEPIWIQRSGPKPAVTSGAAIDLVTETPSDFPRFLGPDQASSVDFSIDEKAFSESKILWKQAIGLGWSGFVARNGYAVTMEQRDENECVSCYEIDSGKLIWLYEHTARHRDRMNLGHVGPRSTPLIHDGMVYAVGAVGNFVCLDGSDGKVRWRGSE